MSTSRTARPPVARPLVVSTDDSLLDDLLRLLATAGAEPELATGGPALRRAHRQAPLVLVGADALSAGAVRALPRRPGVVVVARGELPAADWAGAVAVGAERVAVLPDDESWLLTRCTTAVRAPAERGRLVVVGGACGGAGASTVATAVALAAAPGVTLVDADPWGAGLDLLLGAERAEGLRWPELSGLRGRVAGDALLAALPDVAGVSVVAASRSSPQPVPPEALAAVVDAARSVGCPVVVDLPRSAGGEAVVADADLAVLVVPARLRAATAARLLVEAPDSPWAGAQLVVREVPGGLARGEVAGVVGRPVLADLAHDRSAVPRGERGEPPQVSARSPLGVVARRVLAALRTADAGPVSAPALLDRVRARLAVQPGPPTRAAVAAVVREEAGGLLGDDDVLLAVRTAVDELAGAGPLEPLLRAPGVTDVLVNGPDRVWVDRGRGLELSSVSFPDDDAVRRLAVRLAATVGRRLDDASPWVDVGLPDGTRLHAVLPPVSGSGTCLSLRVLRRTTHSLTELAALGTLPGGSEAVLRAVVARRLAFLVTGGTGSGKTTLLSALLGAAACDDRIVLCEDAPELAPAHPHVVRLVTRPPNVEGVGSVTLRDLVRQALRMRPDRLVVGEVRGAEVVDLLAALNTGHDGGCGTLHANRPAEVPARLEALGVAAGLDRAAVHSQAAAALSLVVHLRRTERGRRVTEIGVVLRSGERIVVEPGWRADGLGAPAADHLAGLLAGEPT